MGRLLYIALCALLCGTPCPGLRLSTTKDENQQELLRDKGNWPWEKKLVVLFWVQNNPDAIAEGAGDPRNKVLMSMADELTKRGHTVLIDGHGFQMEAKYHQDREWLNPKSISRHGKPDLIVSWVNYLHDYGTFQHANFPLIKSLLVDHKIPQIVYENGMLKNSVTVDPQGQLADSYYVERLNSDVQRNWDAETDKACTEFIRGLLDKDSSKRPQQIVSDIPSEAGRFVFVPTQKFNDISVSKYSRVTYPEMLNKVTDFCKAQDLSLVIKIHPHLIGSPEETEQNKLIDELKARYPKVYLTVDSINDLLQKAFFTVTINGGTLMDNFVTTTPVLELAPSLWYKTDAVVYETDLEQGLQRMLKEASPWSEERKIRQRQNVCWYRRMSFNIEKTTEENAEVLQRHLDVLRLSQPLEL